MRGLLLFILGIVFTLAALAAAGYAVVMTGTIPANADARPGGLELWIARNDLRAVLAANAPKGPDPVPLTDANLIAGVRLYADNCAVCHGTSAGESAASPVARGEYPKPPQLATHGVEDDPVGWTFWKIQHGIRLSGMPSWRSALSDQQMWTLALFLKHMDKLPPAPQAYWRSLPTPPAPAPSGGAEPAAAGSGGG